MIRPLAKPSRYAKRERMDYRGSAIPKAPPVADAKFRAFARARGCAVAGLVDLKTGEVHKCEPIDGRVRIEFAHYRVGGKGIKGSDQGNGMGLCHQMHQWLQHVIGWPQFAKRYGFDPVEKCLELASAYDAKFPPKKA